MLDDFYVYFCDSSLHEYRRVFLPPDKDGTAPLAVTGVWIDKTRFAVGTSLDNLIRLYDITDKTPRILLERESAPDTCIVYDAMNQAILYWYNGLSSQSPDGGAPNFRYPSSRSFVNSIGFSARKNEIYVGGKHGYIDVINASDGKLKRKISLKKNTKYVARLYGLSVEPCFNDNCLLIRAKDAFLLYDFRTDSSGLLSLPRFSEQTEHLTGDRFLVFYDAQEVFLLDLTTGVISSQRIGFISRVSWVIPDKALAVTGQAHTKIIPCEAFTPLPHTSAMVPTFVKTEGAVKYVLGLNASLIRKGAKSFAASYRTLRLNDKLRNNLTYHRSYSFTAAVRSDSGLTALAQEMDQTVSVCGRDGRLLYQLEALPIDTENNLTGMEFSHDSRYLMLVCSFSLRVTDAFTGKTVFRQRFEKNPLLEAHFSDDSRTLSLVFADLRTCSIAFLNTSAGREAAQTQDTKSSPDRREVMQLVRTPELMVNRAFMYRGVSLYKISGWFKKSKFYNTGNGYLLYCESGELILYPVTVPGCGECEVTLDPGGYDFSMSFSRELSKTPDGADMLFKCKNDLFSSCYQAGDYLILVSLFFNSVIVIDRSACAVVSAYKHFLPVIGSCFRRDTLELINADGSTSYLRLHFG